MSVVAYVNKTDVFGGPGAGYAKIGRVGSTTGPEQVTVYSYEKGWFFIEYKASGLSKRGYVLESTVVNSATVKNQVISTFPAGYGGTASLKATVYGAPSTTASNLGFIRAGEDVTVFSGNDDGFAFMEYSTLSGVKRGYVKIVELLQVQRGKLCTVDALTEVVYSGPAVTFATVGSVALNECIVALEYDGNWLYIEYNTSIGRKRGYITIVSVDDENVVSYISAANYSNIHFGKILVAQTVLEAPSTGCASIGSVGLDEFVKVIREERGSLFIEFKTSDGNKRGFVALTTVNQNIIFPGEKNAVNTVMNVENNVNAGTTDW